MQEDKAAQEEPGWSFHSQGDAPNDDLPQTAESSGEKQNRKPAGEVSWEGMEYLAHQHSAGWFAALFMVSIAISGLLYIVTKSYFSAGVAVVLGILAGVSASKKPQQISYRLNDDGLSIAERFYPYNDFKSFTIIEEEAASSILLQPIKRFMPPLSAYYSPDKAEQIINTLSTYLPFERGKLDFTDRLARRLRF